MLTLTTGVRVVTDPATGRANLISPAGEVWTLNPTAAVAVTELAGGGTVGSAEEALARRWPAVPRTRLRADLDALLGKLQEAGVVRQRGESGVRGSTR
ncbi:PqqD family peptide modification chaperone [Streptomyces pinistramenti]|uniref:PqqD family peptide modification chaperone n=1 Tax=Streptomyces pinistramenti TaxID=2884812 RepID=UPI001D08F4DE|nr:PqqD family peptide modification chaperone [Streptomyces pinistramenti]MCB5908459.1 PqqD family peptide modification chaperone [Streptomyces pinistramenti]